MSSDNISIETEYTEVINKVDTSALNQTFTHLKLQKPIIYYFMSDDDLLEVNKAALNHDYYTDIITFDYTDDEDISHSEIMISLDRVKENAIEHNESYQRELHRVCIHGMLHISGLDDQTDDEKQKMRLEENRILDLYCST